MRVFDLSVLFVSSTLVAGCLVGPPAEYAAESRVLRITQHASALERITATPAHEKNPAITKDGTMLAYGVADGYEARSRIELAAVGAIERHTALPDGVEAWSPSWIDERTLLYTSRPEGKNVVRAMLIDLADPTSPRVLPSPYSNVSVLWPSAFVASRKIRVAAEITLDVIGTYSAMRYDWHELRVFEGDGLGELNLGRGRYPAFSPDGRRIAFTGDGNRIVVADATSGALLYYLMPGDTPAWSPDGRYLAFCAPGDEGGKDLYVVPFSGGNIVQLTAGTSEACRPAWGPGGWIYFHSNAEKSFDIWRLHVADTATI